MNRWNTGPHDSRIFSNTAATSKAINLGVLSMRGGIRL